MIHLNQIKSKSILVIGDVMIDTYFLGEIKRISPEAPVPVFKYKSERSVPGGAANVAVNLVAASQRVAMMSVVGKDENGEKLSRYIQEKGIDRCLLEPADHRRTTIKTRFLADNNQQVLRLDIEDVIPIDSEVCNRMLQQLEAHIGEYDIVLVSDYLKGVLTYEFTQGIIRIAQAHQVPVLVDVKDPHIEKYKGATLLKPNLKEIRELTGLPAQTDAEIIEAAETLRKRCDCRYVLCTCGARGMVLVGETEQPFFIASEGKEVFDVSGAGDTTIAYLAAAMANGLEMTQAVTLANLAAGIQVSKVGTSSVALHEIRNYLANIDGGSHHKILNAEEVKAFRRTNQDKKIVFTNGCFDILHIGHKRYLQQAASLGDVLVVGVNSDASVRRLKGPTRPVNNEQDRAELLCALGFIDYVVIFEEDTPYNLIQQIQPDVLVKGGDYNPDNVVGRDIVEARGGKLVLIDFVEGKSTTNIINRIKTDNE